MSGFRILLLFVLLVAFISPHSALSTENPRQWQTMTLQTPMEPKKLDEVQEFVDETIRQQNEVMGGVASKIEQFMVDMGGIGAKVKDVTNEWITNPNERTRARLEQAISEGAARGREASQRISAIDAETQKITGNILKGLDGRMQEVRSNLKSAKNRSVAYAAGLVKAQEEVHRAKSMIEQKGWLANGNIPPEMEEKLFKLAVDFQELDSMSMIWKEVEEMLSANLEVLGEARGGYAKINQTTSMIAYQAESMGRLYGAIGSVQAMRIRSDLLATAYKRSEEFQGKISSALDQMRGMRQDILGMLSIPRNLNAPDERTVRGDVERRMSTQGLLEWFKSFDGKKMTKMDTASKGKIQ